ncbi:hypothetical protein [Actinophytocola sp.]|uniref:hypothetical protein n=1 Tax=Actinophytocola sp. TaxID=1872138 RepID=UPI002F932A75
MIERLDRHLRSGWPVLVLLCAIVPLLWMAISGAIRSGLFGLSVPPNTNQVGSFLTFIGATLGAVATLCAALLTSGHNARERQRLRLETVLRSLALLPEGAKKSRLAGILSTMVLLGQERIALRVLQPAWDGGLVDDGTATWLIGQVLAGNRPRNGTDSDQVDDEARNEAAVLLVDRAGRLADLETGRYYFPGHFMRTWRTKKEVPAQAKLDLLHAMAEMLASRERDWWSPSGDLPEWPTSVLLECVRRDRDPKVKAAAAVLLDALRECFPDQFSRRGHEVDDIQALAAAARTAAALPAVHFSLAERIKVGWRRAMVVNN